MSAPISEKEPGPPGDLPVESQTPPEATPKKREYKDFGHEEEKPTRGFRSFFVTYLGTYQSLRCECRHVYGGQLPYSVLILTLTYPLKDRVEGRGPI